MDNFIASARPFESLKSKLETYNTYDLTRDYHSADRQYEILCEYIKEFQDELDNDHEVCIQLASFGQSILMQVTDIGYANPSLITFDGYVNGQHCQLIQHVNQLSFLLMSSPKAEPEKPPRRIGFHFENE